MLEVLSADEMRDADRRAIEVLGISSLTLMENAGAAAAAVVRRRFGAPRITILCGKGNNGGDGLVVARHLADLSPQVFLSTSRDALSKDAAINAARLDSCGIGVVEVAGAEEWLQLRASALDCDVVVDALLGTGFHGAVDGLLGAMIEDLGRRRPERPAVVAIDIPSGVADSGEIDGPAVRADITVAFARPKRAHAFPPGSRQVGELLVADIGIPALAFQTSGEALFLSEPKDAAAAWPPRARDAHKGDFGHLLVIGGSFGKTGAAVLSALGALRAGAGLVTVASTRACLGTIAVGAPEIMTAALSGDDALAGGQEAVDAALQLADERDALVIGPGCGRDPGTARVLQEFLRASMKPAVVDADALHALGALATGIGEPRPWILTPHPGEAGRLLGATASMVMARRLVAVREIARRSGAVTVLKGECTLVADPQGRVTVNPTGGPAMAKGGSGDVLAGVAGALLARGADPWIAATAAVYAHGAAADRCARSRGQEGVLASEIAAEIGPVVRDLCELR